MFLKKQSLLKFMAHKTITAQVHGSNFVIFNFLKKYDFFWNSVKSLNFLIA